MRLLKQKVDVYAQVGDEGHNSELDFITQKKRSDNTINWMCSKGIDLKNNVVLDIAGPSVLGKEVCKDSIYLCTNGDLDTLEWKVEKPEVDIVLMWEVIEHLLNPLLFLIKLKEQCKFKYMVVTFPTRPSWLWTNLHFHEMRLDRFEYLCKRAGYEIVAVKRDKIPTHYSSMFKGIRPFIRFFYNPHYNVLIKPK